MNVDCLKLLSNVSNAWSGCIRGVFYCLFKGVPVVECLITSRHKYQGKLSLCWYLVGHEDHLHVALENLPSGHFVGCSPVHLRILLPWDCHRHCDLKDGPLRNHERELVDRLLCNNTRY